MNFFTFRLRLLTLLCLGAGIFSCSTGPVVEEAAERVPSQRPNIVWLVAEDLSPLLPSFGDSTVRTPNIERLAAEGIRFPNVFSTSGVCAPSRATLATGMYHNSIGAHNMRTLNIRPEVGIEPYEVVPPPEVRMMSETLRANGYYCTNNAKTDYQFRPTVTAWDENSPYAYWGGRAEDQPFFSIFNFEITHESQVFGPSMKRHFRFDEGFPLDPESNAVPPWGERIDSSEWTMHVPPGAEIPIPPYLPETEAVRRDVRRVYSNIVELDKQIGAVLDELEEDGLIDNTIIVFYTDHGGPLPRQKRLLYDSGLRVPMIVRYPDGFRAGEIDSQLVSFVDFAPTALSMAGIEPPEWMQGRACLGEYDAPGEREYIHAAADRLDEYYDMIRAVRDRRYKYLRNFKPEQGYYLPLAYREQMASMQELLRLRDAGELDEVQMQWFRQSKPEEELFDTWNDPHEIRNLADDPAYAEKLKELREECERWMAAIQDKGTIPEKELVETFRPGGEQPVTEQAEIIEDNGKILLRCPTIGASIGYKIIENGEEPPHWTVYTGPFVLPQGASLEVITDRIGFAPGEVVGLEQGG